jgi:hypothetical protein
MAFVATTIQVLTDPDNQRHVMEIIMGLAGDAAIDRRHQSLMSRVALLLAVVLMAPGSRAAPESATEKPGDPHYSGAGFFDIHVCNWPGRRLFFMPLFSTTRSSEVKQIDVFTPTGELLVELDLNHYRTLQREKKPDKRVFIKQVDVPPAATDGWYSARIILTDNEVFTAKDYVIIYKLPQAAGQSPANKAELAEVPARLYWEPVPGANYYEVFIRDLWDDDKLVYASELLHRPEIELPPGVLKKGGTYSWVIHARDTDSHILLGDFNHGSMTTPATFSVTGSPDSP